MISFDFEYVLGNLSFACLFVMVIWYWVKSIFSLRGSLQFIGAFGMATANLSLAGLLISRWLISGHFPLSNLFESLLFLSWGFTAFHLGLERISKADFIGVITAPMAFLTNAFATFSLPHEMQKTTALIPALQSNWLMMHVTIMIMSYVALISGSLLSIAYLVVSWYDSKKLPTPPSTGGGYRTPSTNSDSFSQFTQGAGNSVINCRGIVTNDAIRWPAVAIKPPTREVKAYQEELDMFEEPYSVDNSRSSGSKLPKVGTSPQQELTVSSKSSVLSITPQFSERISPRNSYLDEFDDFSPFAQTLDNLSYRTLGLGFPLLTVGILSGAVWANEAWGSYWSWDPKETWAFITWLVFAIYLHTRLGKGWKGTKPAAIAAAGFFVVWMCYLGVNLLGTGLHSYGWLRSGG